MAKYKKVEYNKSMLGKDVTVIVESSNSDKFKIGAAYKGKLKDEVDRLTGYPVFECNNGILGVNSECYLVKKLEE